MTTSSPTTRTTTSGRSWEAYHHRAQAVRSVLAELDATHSDELPWDDELAQDFLDRDDLLEALHAAWTRRLLGRVDLALETGTGTPEESVRAAWLATRRDLPGLRDLLDRYADSEVARRCVAGEHRLLAVAAGLATLSDPTAHSAALGAALVDSLAPAGVPSRRHSRLGWLKVFRHAPTAA